MLLVGWGRTGAQLASSPHRYDEPTGYPLHVFFALGLLTGAVLLTWLYSGSRGSILVVALFHATVDVAFTSDLASPFVINATGGLTTLFGLAVVLIAGYQDLSRSGRVVLPPGTARVQLHESGNRQHLWKRPSASAKSEKH